MRVVDRFRRPEYTGENRCLPCTAANACIAVVAAAVVGYAWFALAGAGWWLAGAAVLGGGAVSIWLRGYLVPGTPELTKRYFPDWLLAKFDKGPAAGVSDGDAPGTDAATGTADAGAGSTSAGEQAYRDPEAVLRSAGAVEPCEHEDDVCLTDAFRSAWHDRMAAISERGSEREELARQIGFDPETLAFEDRGDAFVATHEGRRISQWESRAALVADLAAARELADRVTDWEGLTTEARTEAIGGLRIFLEECPTCEGPVDVGRDTVESCCRSHEVVAAACRECGARLLEVPYQEAA